jgi:hypothetical protein
MTFRFVKVIQQHAPIAVKNICNLQESGYEKGSKVRPASSLHAVQDRVIDTVAMIARESRNVTYLLCVYRS